MHFFFFFFLTTHCFCRVQIREVLHCRGEQTQTQHAQYNEFGKEVDSRTDP